MPMKLNAAAGTITRNPRSALLSPKIRRPRRDAPPSRGTANRRETGATNHAVCATPAITNAATRKRAHPHAFMSDLPSRFGAVLKQEHVARHSLGEPYPLPAADFVVRRIRDAMQAVAREKRVHVVQFVRVEMQHES